MLYIFCDNDVFLDIARELCVYFTSRNIVTQVTGIIHKNNSLDVYIIFGMNDFVNQVVPTTYIVYQLEQTISNDQSQWFSQRYIEYMKGALQVWDYSLVNYQHLKKIGIENVFYVPLQYMKSCDSQEEVESTKDIDVLFYGSLNERRRLILTELKSRGLHVVTEHQLWRDDRMDLIRRSKIVINIHYYDEAILETARLSYLLSNRVTVVSEKSQDPILDKWHTPFVELVEYNGLVDKCQEILKNYNSYTLEHSVPLSVYTTMPYSEKIPQSIFGIFLSPHELPSTSTPSAQSVPSAPDTPEGGKGGFAPLFEAEHEITKDNSLVLKLPKFTDKQLPSVSVITITRNRKNIFPIAIRNWLLFDYPRDKMEWIIVDDSDDGSSLSSILPKSKYIKYHKLTTTGPLSIGQKRNYGVKQAETDYIVFMDDDDYYYPLSIYSRIALLLKYPSYNLVGVTDLDIYDVVNEFSARVKGQYISEASMAFRKSFWIQQPFDEQQHTLGEGYPFTKNRRDQIVKMPSCFNIIAFTHWSNYTQNNRSHDKFKHVTKKDSILSVLDISTRLFIIELWETVCPRGQSPL